MKKILIFLILAGLLASAFPVLAADASNPKADPNPQAKKLAETVSMITGVAISPMLGVGAVGAYKWWEAPKEKRDALPWFAQPWFFLPALLLVGACFVKDSVGIAIPTALKKPFDVAETVEHKISGIVATGAFVPIAASIFHSPDPGSASLAALGFATIDLHWLYNALMVPFAMIAFFIVFLASNAINILIILSPFTTVDTALKGFRTAILASVVGTSFVNPWVGVIWAIIIILISWLIAGWSFRLSHFGLVFVWDFFTGRKNRFQPDPKENKMFLGSKTLKVPTRTYGRLARNEKGELIFSYHPWLVLPRQTIVLPVGIYEAGRGLFYSEIIRLDGEETKTAMLLPPRYLGHEEAVTVVYQLHGTRDVGLRAAWGWFKSLFGGRSAAV